MSNWGMELPSGRKVEQPDKPADWLGAIRPNVPATDDAIRYAEGFFLQGNRDDFRRDGKDWIDKASGVAYRAAAGNPLMSGSPQELGIALFVVAGDGLVFLRRRDDSQVKSAPVGVVQGSRYEPETPDYSNADGPIVY